jgi:SAM-dependent methyltransferase
MINHRVCPLCLSDNKVLHLRCTDHLVSQEEFDIYRCGSCGFTFTDNYPDESETGRFYESSDYISHDDNARGFINKVYRLARVLMLGRKRRAITKITGRETGRLLDIGCGTGYFPGMMKNHGWEVTGVEPGKKARDFARTSFGIEVIDPGQISTLPSATYDCITLWHTLEHFHDPQSYAGEIRRLLSPEGICLVAIPNCSSYDALYFGKFWAAWDVPRHLWHFEPGTFSLFAEKEGFSIIKTMALPLDVFYISILSLRHKEITFPFAKGIALGFWFSLKAFFVVCRSSSLIYFLKQK